MGRSPLQRERESESCFVGDPADEIIMHGDEQRTHGGILGYTRHQETSGRLVCQSVALSKTRAVRSRFSSENAGPRSCRPIGSPGPVRPQGMLMPGMPARLAVIV